MSVCVKCQANMTVFQIGVALVQTVGKDHKPHSVRQADIEACPWCGVQIIARAADEAIEHFEKGFQEAIDLAKSQDRLYFVHEKIIQKKD